MLEVFLIVIVCLVLILPLGVGFVEKNLEVFLFIMGVLAVSFSHLLGSEPVWSLKLVEEVVKEPLMITLAVLMFGLAVYAFKAYITRFIVHAERKLGSKLFCFALVTALGLLSSVITAIIAAIVLVETVSALKLSKDYEIKLVVLGCFAIGLGAALTPVGEPLSTICVSKLRGEPFNADFFFLMKHLGAFIIPGVVGIGVIGAFIEPSVKVVHGQSGLREKEKETIKDILTRSLKVYIFVMALILLGTGFKSIVDKYVVNLPIAALYWLNSVSAVLDNATLAAAEISPKMALAQIQAVLMGLLVAGGMLIPGNIPNIISAGRLGITSRQWAKIAVPLGLILMTVYFVILMAVRQ
jgi:predicted cation transporter